MSFEDQRESVLNAIVTYRLLHNFVQTKSQEDWLALEALISDTEAGEFELLLGMTNLCSILLWEVAMIANVAPNDVLSAIGQGTATIEDIDDSSNG